MGDAILSTIVAGISYDPEIRGVLVTVVSAAILCGSVYLLLSTNIGARLGFQVALAGLFGWMMLLCLFWWIYGVGAVGQLPSWRVEEINIGNLEQAQLDEARELVPENLPDPAQILEDHPEVAEQFEAGDEPTLSEIAALPDLPDELSDQLDGVVGEWDVLSQAAIGDAQAAADAALISGEGGLQYSASTEYVLLNGFEQGGKPERQGDGWFDRVANKVTNTLRVLNPPHYVVIQVQTSESQAVPEGNAPLPARPDPDEPVVSVIMVRDLGTLRLPPAVMTFMFGGLFALTCWTLHNRDERARRLSTATGS
jgi:hypothetical protein